MKIRVGGDVGDSIASLKVIRDIGGTHKIFFVDRGPTKIIDRVPLIQSLFESQPYIESVECSEESVDVDLTGFRRFHSSTTALWAAQSSEYTHQSGKLVKQNSSPWVSVEPDPSFSGKVIVARSERYRNIRMDQVWEAAVKLYTGKIIFVGLPHEHVIFSDQFGAVPHLQVRDFKQMASAMASCALVIANQSSPQILAMSLGCNIVQETCDFQPDVILDRKNVQYCADGECLLPDIDGSGKMYLPAVPDFPLAPNFSLVPPNGWQYPRLPASYHFKIQRGLVAKLEGCPEPEAEKKLFRHNALMHPKFFLGTDSDPLHLFRIAMANAFPAEKRAFPEPSISI